MIPICRRIPVLCVTLAAIVAASRARGDEPRRPIAETDLFRFVWAADPQLAADGSKVAFVRVTVDRDKDDYETSIWAVPSAGGEPRRLTNGPRDAWPRWSPDGSRLLFLRRPEGGDAKGQRRRAQRLDDIIRHGDAGCAGAGRSYGLARHRLDRGALELQREGDALDQGRRRALVALPLVEQHGGEARRRAAGQPVALGHDLAGVERGAEMGGGGTAHPLGHRHHEHAAVCRGQQARSGDRTAGCERRREIESAEQPALVGAGRQATPTIRRSGRGKAEIRLLRPGMTAVGAAAPSAMPRMVLLPCVAEEDAKPRQPGVARRPGRAAQHDAAEPMRVDGEQPCHIAHGDAHAAAPATCAGPNTSPMVRSMRAVEPVSSSGLRRRR